ncbi:MAG: hypothetical protein NEA02_08135 [Thermoanaerobaculia bacterium]|nr:hypothetical protein [Thermoanaerobaculia bacterium]
MRNFLIFVAAIVLAVWYFRRPPSETSTAPAGGGASAPSRGPGCLSAAESANRSLSDATRLLLSMPVDASRWSDAESVVHSAISRAESTCSGGSTEAEREGMETARDALSLMRTALAEGAKAAAGAGGFQGAVRQEAIDNRLASARAKLGLR